MSAGADSAGGRRRRAARVLLFDDRDAVLLFHEVSRPDRAGWWYTPGGELEPGETEVEAARRELLEETGYAAESLTRLGRHWANNGVARAEVVVFLARELLEDTTEDQELEGITEVSTYSWSDVRRMVRDGTISDSESVGALMLAAIELGWA